MKQSQEYICVPLNEVEKKKARGRALKLFIISFTFSSSKKVEKKKARGRALKQTQSLFLPQSYPHVEKKKARGRALKRFFL